MSASEIRGTRMSLRSCGLRRLRPLARARLGAVRGRRRERIVGPGMAGIAALHLRFDCAVAAAPEPGQIARHLHGDRKSTRLNSSHVAISYAVFCLKKKKKKK